MPAKDLFHHTVKNALIKGGWKITHDPYILTFGKRDLYETEEVILKWLN